MSSSRIRNPFLLTGEIYGVVSAHQSPPRGSGKSLTALHLVLEQADYLNYPITFNFNINATALYHYCLYMKYYNVIRYLRKGEIRVASVVDYRGKSDLAAFVAGTYRIYVLDEAGIFCSSRNWQGLSDKWQSDLAMLRQFHVRLWWISQHYSHVDKILRNQTNYIVECSSVLRSSTELQGASKIVVRVYYVYINKAYEYLDGKASRISGFNLKFHRFRGAFFKKFLRFDDSDVIMFSVYQSFSRSIGDKPIISNFPSFASYKVKEIPSYVDCKHPFHKVFDDVYRQSSLYREYLEEVYNLASDCFPVSQLSHIESPVVETPVVKDNGNIWD